MKESSKESKQQSKTSCDNIPDEPYIDKRKVLEVWPQEQEANLKRIRFTLDISVMQEILLRLTGSTYC